MKLWSKGVVAATVALCAIQVVRPKIPAKPLAAEVQAPPEVKRILEKDCYSCHSDERRLSWFDEIVPAYWLVRHDVLTAREHLNFSTLGSKPVAAQKGALFEAANMIQLGAMPLPQFVQLHPEAKVTDAELQTLKTYLAPWSVAPPAGDSADGRHAGPNDGAKSSVVPVVSLEAVQPEWNGVAFEPLFEGWKLLSTTDRGDNNTFRFILGNDVAVRAVREGTMSPWPDGSRLAKIAWQQELGGDGLVMPGKFIQVELMVKDASRYKSTDGWGWGRWRGLDLKPYGNSAKFTVECTGCHLPVAGDDYVYTLPMTTANTKGTEIVNARAAALPAGLPNQPLGWSAITMFVDQQRRITSTLYGNDAAMTAVHFREAGIMDGFGPKYSRGAVLALVTWAQRDDPHWFGGRIPDAPLSVEFIEVADADGAGRYRRFAGEGLTETAMAAADATKRMEFILRLQPVRLP
ncbi:MAG: cytochrome P460 family protein [Terracidiphilus sp.]